MTETMDKDESTQFTPATSQVSFSSEELTEFARMCRSATVTYGVIGDLGPTVILMLAAAYDSLVNSLLDGGGQDEKYQLGTVNMSSFIADDFDEFVVRLSDQDTFVTRGEKSVMAEFAVWVEQKRADRVFV